VALIDPSAQWADPEFELAFIALMGGVSGAFWDRYAERRAMRPGFHERRVFAYQAYPLAVHAALFGGGYGARAMDALERATA
jgi:fructosamine-3-kinase